MYEGLGGGAVYEWVMFCFCLSYVYHYCIVVVLVLCSSFFRLSFCQTFLLLGTGAERINICIMDSRMASGGILSGFGMVGILDQKNEEMGISLPE